MMSTLGFENRLDSSLAHNGSVVLDTVFRSRNVICGNKGQNTLIFDFVLINKQGTKEIYNFKNTLP